MWLFAVSLPSRNLVSSLGLFRIVQKSHVLLPTFHDNRSRVEFERCLSIDVVASIEESISRFFRAETVDYSCELCDGDEAVKTLRVLSGCVSIVIC